MSSFVQALDVEQQQEQTQVQGVSTSLRRSFGMGALTGGVAFALVGALALLVHQPSSTAYPTAEVNAFAAPTGVLPNTKAQPVAWSLTQEQTQLVQQMAAKDGIATRAATQMFAKGKKFGGKAGEFCYGLPGALPPAQNFDPAGLSRAPFEDVKRWREAELTHGRIGMLASLGFITQEGFHPLFNSKGGTAGELFAQTPVGVWFGILFGIALCEGYRATQVGKPDRIPGDVGFDPLGFKPSDPAEFRKKQEAELNNGRLGMLAAAGFIVQEAVSGTTFSQNFWNQ